MLGALLLNIPQEVVPPPITSSGPLRGYGTTWNKDWSKKYGPEAQEAKLDKEKILEAVEAIQEAEYVPPQMQEIKEIVHKRSLVDELEAYQPDTDLYIIYVLEAYLYFCDWRKKDDEDIATILLLM